MSLTLQLVNEDYPAGWRPRQRSRQRQTRHRHRTCCTSRLDTARSDRYISSKHCEIRYKDGGYWLYDVSTNGTFLNGAEQRMPAPHGFATATVSRSGTTSSP
jgi:predicted component of type VI protein secretion system